MRIFRFSSQDEIEKIMHDIGVDPYGIKIMLPKTQSLLVRLNGIKNVAANIIKQEMLSLGAEAAITKNTLTLKAKKTDVLLTGTLTQFRAFIEKLKHQPFGLNDLSIQLSENLQNYNQEKFVLKLRSGSLSLGQKTRIMGIINLTPDSFSGDGLYKKENKNHPQLALARAKEMIRDGADLIDIGGQSSKPGTKFISTKEELARTIPAIKLISKNINKPISIDTLNYKVAQSALEAGAQIVNDISGLRDKRMRKVVSRQKAAVVIMHMLGTPENMQKNIKYNSLVEDISNYLKNSIDAALAEGIGEDKIIVDPGIGFGKTVQNNLEILKNLSSFKVLGKPILVGASKKSFIGKTLGFDQKEINTGTLASSVIASINGANILRVHDVKEAASALKLSEAVKNAN